KYEAVVCKVEQIHKEMDRIIAESSEFQNIRREFLRSRANSTQYGANFCGVERILHNMERIFAASSGFHTIWSEFLRRRADSTQYGVNFCGVERIPHNMEQIFTAASDSDFRLLSSRHTLFQKSSITLASVSSLQIIS